MSARKRWSGNEPDPSQAGLLTRRLLRRLRDRPVDRLRRDQGKQTQGVRDRRQDHDRRRGCARLARYLPPRRVQSCGLSGPRGLVRCRAPPHQRASAPRLAGRARSYHSISRNTTMHEIAPPAPSEKRAVTTSHALEHGPRRRAVRALLETTHIRHELQDVLAAALARARRRRDRPLCHLLEAAALATHDLGGEVDAAGMALCQISVLWGYDEL